MRESIKTITLKRMVSAAVVIVVFVIIFIAYNFRELTFSAMADKGDTVSRFVEQGLTTHMQSNSHIQREAYIENIEKTAAVERLNIVHSDEISKQFKMRSHVNYLSDPVIATVFKSGKPNYALTIVGNNENMLRVTFPYLAEQNRTINCLSCHNANNKDVLGVVDFYIDMTKYKQMSLLYLYIILGILSLILIAILMMMFNLIDRHIKQPLDELMDNTKQSFYSHKPIDIDSFESMELQDVAYKVNMFNEEVLKQRDELIEKNCQLIDLNNEIEQTQKEIINTMGNIVENRSKETAYHVQRVAAYSYLLAKKCGLSIEDCELIKSAAPMHDVGKVGIPDGVLHKPGRLTDSEFETIKEHSRIGFEIFKNSERDMLKTAAIIAHEHHERWDGLGYPRGLKGDEIHIFGRIVAIADVFDALGTHRVYKESWPLDKILDFLKSESGKRFDPKLVEIFLENIDEIEHLMKTNS